MALIEKKRPEEKAAQTRLTANFKGVGQPMDSRLSVPTRRSTESKSGTHSIATKASPVRNTDQGL